MQTENICPAAKCFDAMLKKKGAFADVEGEITCIGVNTCGGCPGKNAAQRARHMVRQGADAIAISSCITLGTPLGFPCPFHKKILDIVKSAVGENVQVLEYTHPAKTKKSRNSPAGS